MSTRALLIAAVVLALACFPPQWYPDSLRLQLAEWFGTPAYRAPPANLESAATASAEQNPRCPPDISAWRESHQLDGVDIRPALTCQADDPHAIAAFVKGTNNIAPDILAKSGLSIDAVEKSQDIDQDGDPDVIHIRLEVAELNGSSPDGSALSAQYAIAPGIKPGLWLFAPKHLGMATENFESEKARALLRAPSPVIRVEQGDRVQITLENSHYMPHTIHFHGVDHPFRDANGEGNDGVPITSEKPVMPGRARTYDLQPRQTGTMFYHCHVQPQAHVMMGLQGIFVVEENLPNNPVQTLNIGAGQVRAPSAASRNNFDREYDLHYTDIDKSLNNLIQRYTDPRHISEQIHRRYNVSGVETQYHLLNGLSFPYTFRDSLVVAKPDEKIKLRIANGGTEGVALHTHGHKATITHYDGVALESAARVTRDVVWIANAQRVDMTLRTSNDGLHAYGSGVWLLHDHQGKGIVNDGIGPGGNVSAIVYEEYLDEQGWPQTFGMDWAPFFTEQYYRGEVPVFGKLFSAGQQAEMDRIFALRIAGLLFALGLFVGALFRGRRHAP